MSINIKEMNLPSNWPIKNSPIFEHHAKRKGFDVYKLNTLMLSDDECHMFFPIIPCEELLIATGLEFTTFHPANKKINDKFKIDPVQCGDIQLFWCSFPKEFKDVCERIAKVFGMTMKIMPREIAAGDSKTDKGTLLQFPMKENILYFQGNRCNNPNKIEQEMENIIWIGNSLEKLKVD